MANVAVAPRPPEAVKPPIAASAPARRFEIPDIDRHGGWLLERLQKVYKDKTPQQIVAFLRGAVYSNEMLFLYKEHGVALAAIWRPHPLEPKPIIQEVFVLAEPGYEADAADFYDNFAQWAKRQDIDTILVEELTDVPHEAIKEKLGRVFTKTINFAKL